MHVRGSTGRGFVPHHQKVVVDTGTYAPGQCRTEGGFHFFISGSTRPAELTIYKVELANSPGNQMSQPRSLVL